MTTYNVPEIGNWPEWLEKVWNGEAEALAQAKVLRAANRAFNRLSRHISYGYEMAAAFDGGEWSGAGESEDQENCFNMVAERFGIECADDIDSMENEDHETGFEAFQLSHEPRYYRLIIHPSKLKREHGNLADWDGCNLLPPQTEEIHPVICVEYNHIYKVLNKLRNRGIKAQLDDGTNEMPDEGFYGPDSDPSESA